MVVAGAGLMPAPPPEVCPNWRAGVVIGVVAKARSRRASGTLTLTMPGSWGGSSSALAGRNTGVGPVRGLGSRDGRGAGDVAG